MQSLIKWSPRQMAQKSSPHLADRVLQSGTKTMKDRDSFLTTNPRHAALVKRDRLPTVLTTSVTMQTPARFCVLAVILCSSHALALDLQRSGEQEHQSAFSAYHCTHQQQADHDEPITAVVAVVFTARPGLAHLSLRICCPVHRSTSTAAHCL